MSKNFNSAAEGKYLALFAVCKSKELYLCTYLYILIYVCPRIYANIFHEHSVQ